MDGIDLSAFERAGSVSRLRTNRCSDLPGSPGVYLVLRDRESAPRFLVRSTGGWFKGEDPSYEIDVVHNNWVDGASIVYIGMTGSRKGLRDRIRKLVDFGGGKPVAHRGGRMLWHLEDSGELEVLWQQCDRSRADDLESTLIEVFRQRHGVRPFANMAK